jgi:histidinol phosphatase-like enzyme (inositol monophosphatase family)
MPAQIEGHELPPYLRAMTPTLQSILEVALEAAHEGGRVTLGYFQTSNLAVDLKRDASPVTIADRMAEERIGAIVRSRFPRHSLLGEESGATIGSEPYQWIIDPIDGTKSFISGVPLYGVMIGVVVEGVPSVGVVHFPALGDTHWGVRGAGLYWNGRRSRVSECASLEEARLLTTDMRRARVDAAKASVLEELGGRVRLVRSWGDCYGHMLVATGRAEMMLDPRMSIWDCAALLPIIEESGGCFTDWRGAARIDGGDAISTNGALHDEVMGIVTSASAQATSRAGAAARA